MSTRSLHPLTPWPARLWPYTASEEQAFIAELVEFAARYQPKERPTIDATLTEWGWARDDLTMCLTALRAGCPLDVVLQLAPGVDPTGMLAGYRHLEQLLAAGASAWAALIASTTPARITEHAIVAVKLLPAPVGRILETLDDPDPAVLTLAISEEVAAVETTRAEVDRVIAEVAVVDTAEGIERLIDLGLELFRPDGECLWNHTSFLPERVGELTPLKVSDLLGERRDPELSPDD